MKLQPFQRSVVPCPKCGVEVNAEMLERRRQRYEQYGKVMGISGPSFEEAEDVSILPHLFGSKSVACGVCMTKRKK